MINQDNQSCVSQPESKPSSLTLPLTLLLNKLYAQCLSGGYGLDSAYEIAKAHEKRFKYPVNALDSLIKQESKKAALGGVLTGLGGVISLPITIPANLTSTLFIQMRLVTAIAILQGHDVKDERIKALVYLSLCVMTGKHKLQHICFDVMMKQNKEIITKFSQNITCNLISILCAKHGVKFIRVIPFLGGITGGAVDGLLTYQIGLFAKRQFS